MTRDTRGTDIRVKDVSVAYEDYLYRTPIKFGGVALDRVTLLNVDMTVETRAGKVARGFGSMPLGNVWAWPSKTLKYDETLAGMKAVSEKIAHNYKGNTEPRHPIELTTEIEPYFFTDADMACHSIGLREPIPHLATLVVASPFDAALHDAYGTVHGLNCYHTYSPPFFDDDLGDYFGAEFVGEQLHRYISREPKARMPLYHLVGALDPLTDADVKGRLNDGLPETLGEWVARDGLTHLKVKLNGDDLGWDVDRVVGVNRVANETAPDRPFQFSLDFNERCQTVEYLLEVLHRVRAASPVAFDRIQYVEQPTARDLKANPANKMHEAAKLKPVVIDESLIDLESMQLAREMGYTGVAFKACKGQTQTLLMAAAAQKYGLFRCVQDLTCVGASLIHSAGIAAHIPGVAAIESNGRQYCPAANAAWEERFPGVFTVRDGTMNTAILNGVGLGATV
jgi:L-alanine-DL-glutamate epimerase-like enolase superfamily enzyme